MIEPQIRITAPGAFIDPWGDFVEIRYAEHDRERGTLAIAQPVEMKVFGPQDREPCMEVAPMLRLPCRNTTVLQQMMNQLWQMGIRPAEVGTTGHLAATNAHLQDMRALVGNFMKVELPKA